MEINHSKSGNLNFIELKGRMDSINTHLFEQKIIQLISKENNSFIFNCANLEYISSTGMRSFLMVIRKLNEVGGKLVLTSLQENVKEVFELSGFASIFEFAKSEKNGIKKF